MSAFFLIMRPHQYIKNLFIFLPLFFALKISDVDLLISSVLAFIAFSLTASAVYVLNDLIDIEEDKKHPKKKKRPIASGFISKIQGLLTIFFLSIVGFSLMASINMQTVLILFCYVAMNILYSFFLKHVAILDVTIIAVGFVLRLFVGSGATGVSLSMWIVIMTFLLALFMALGKRRDDVLIYNDTGNRMRRVVDGYTLKFLEGAMVVMASVVIVAYTLYTTSAEVLARFHSEYLYLTALFVILGIMRYMQIAFVLNDSGSPTLIVLKDRFMQLTLLGWILSFSWILYV